MAIKHHKFFRLDVRPSGLDRIVRKPTWSKPATVFTEGGGDQCLQHLQKACWISRLTTFGTPSKRLGNGLMHVDLLILDVLGYLPFTQSGGALFFYQLFKLYERTSLVNATNMNLPEWAKVAQSST